MRVSELSLLEQVLSEKFQNVSSCAEMIADTSRGRHVLRRDNRRGRQRWALVASRSAGQGRCVRCSEANRIV